MQTRVKCPSNGQIYYAPSEVKMAIFSAEVTWCLSIEFDVTELSLACKPRWLRKGTKDRPLYLRQNG